MSQSHHSHVMYGRAMGAVTVEKLIHINQLLGDFAGATALHPADNYGALWQFTEEPPPGHTG